MCSTSEEGVLRRWKEYFQELLNEENETEHRNEESEIIRKRVDQIRKDEIRKALNQPLGNTS